MAPIPAEVIAAELGRISLRQTRARLYAALTAGIDGVDEATYPVLSGLARTGSATVTELSDEVGLYRSVTTRHAVRLAASGLIRRSPHPADGRASVLSLTDAGAQAVTRMRRNLTALVQDATRTWDEARLATFAHDLHQLLVALEELGRESGQAVDMRTRGRHES